MSLDDRIRASADALATGLGRRVHEMMSAFIDQVIATAEEQRALAAQETTRALAAAADRIEKAASRARDDAARELENALADVREEAGQRAADALARSREQAATELAIALARLREEVEQQTAVAVARAGEEATTEILVLQQLDARTEVSIQGGDPSDLSARMDRLVAGFRQLDAASSLSAILEATADMLAREAPRTALFVVRGRNLQGWRFSGFADAPSDPRAATIALEAAGGLARVVEDRVRSEIRLPAFPAVRNASNGEAADVEIGVAVPITVGGEVAAILYGDAGSVEGPHRSGPWADALELVARHAARCLEAQAALRAARFAGVTSAVA
jgi:hypothetical protein